MMKPGYISFTGRWREMTTAIAAVTGGILLAALLSDGTAGGDEGGVLSFLSYFEQGGWHAVTNRFPDNAYLAHRLFWMIEKIGWNQIVDLLLPQALRQSPLIDTYALVLDGPLFMVAAFALAVWHLLKRGYTFSIALLAPSCLLLASSGISLFTGGFSECAMSLLVVAIVCLLDREKPLICTRLGLVITCAILLTCAKLYAGPFVLVLGLLLRGPAWHRIVYVLSILFAPLAWMVLQALVRGGGGNVGGMVQFYTQLMTVLSPSRLAGETLAFFLSLPFGLLTCFPLLPVALLAGTDARRSFLIKVAAVGAVISVLLPFGFWFGPGGTGGPRYIIPFLLIFLPEIARGLTRLAAMQRMRRLILAIPLMVALFLPVLEYRNSMIGHYGGQNLDVTHIAWPHADPGMHPAAFAWRVLDAKWRKDPDFAPSPMLDITLPTAEIFPMTGLSRVIYLLGQPKARPVESNAVHSLLSDWLLHSATAWTILRALLVTSLLGILTLAAIRAAGGRP